MPEKHPGGEPGAATPIEDVDDEWEGTMEDVSHTPEVGDRVPGIWHRGDE